MSLNKYMHPRNRYKNTKPSFLELALKYPEFRTHTTQNESGKVFLDFKNADALRALTTCLLKEDFGITVVLPMDRLVPALPLRLNYIHWLEDIIGTEHGKWGIDIGTGASCIYPLLAAKMNQWCFLATEADDSNFYHANQNVEKNGLKELIHLKQVSSEDALIAPLESFTVCTKFDFCMCNPPFFADRLEAQAITTSKSVDRPEGSSVSTASPEECITFGGEVGFIRQMIDESSVLREKIRVYSSMVGKKSSLARLKQELRHHKVDKFSTTELCQGKTMRWGIAWTFDKTVNFPTSQFQSRKDRPPLRYVVPKAASGSPVYEVHAIAQHLKDIMESIKVHCYQGKKAKSYTSITLTAAENTWCHQRRLRRQQQRKEQQQMMNDVNSNQTSGSAYELSESKTDDEMKGGTREPNDIPVADCVDRKRRQMDNYDECGDNPIIQKKLKTEENMKIQPDNIETIKLSEREQCSDAPKIQNVPRDTTVGTNGPSGSNHTLTVSCANTPDNTMTEIENATSSCQKSGSEDISVKKHEAVNDEADKATAAAPSDTSPKQYVLKCVMRLKRQDESLQLELEWLDGESRELLHQLFTFIKNKLTFPAESKLLERAVS